MFSDTAGIGDGGILLTVEDVGEVAVCEVPGVCQQREVDVFPPKLDGVDVRPHVQTESGDHAFHGPHCKQNGRVCQAERVVMITPQQRASGRAPD